MFACWGKGASRGEKEQMNRQGELYLCVSWY